MEELLGTLGDENLLFVEPSWKDQKVDLSVDEKILFI